MYDTDPTYYGPTAQRGVPDMVSSHSRNLLSQYPTPSAAVTWRNGLPQHARR